MNTLSRFAIAIVLASTSAGPVLARQAVWLRQDGSALYDNVAGAAADGSGGLFVGGSTQGDFGGTSAGEEDAWLARFDASGQRLWLAQFGSSRRDWLAVAASDGTNGVFVGGSTTGSLGAANPDPSGATADAWLAHYSSAGARTWLVQWGTAGSEQLVAVVDDGAGGAFLGGFTSGSLSAPNLGESDAWLARCDAAGQVLWSTQFGTSGFDGTFAVAPDGAGGVFAAGSEGALNGFFDQAWLARYSGAGQQLWRFELPATALGQSIFRAQPDGAGGVFVLGQTISFPYYKVTGWVARYDSAGVRAWIHFIGPAGSLTRDALGHIYVGGANGALARLDSAGQYDWALTIFGPAEHIGSVAPTNTSGVFIAGTTYSDLGAPSAGDGDAWVALIDVDVAAGYCTGATTTSGCLPAVRSVGRPSASASTPFVLTVAQVEGERQGLLFYGIDNSGFTPRPWAPWSSSYLCVRAPRARLPIQASGGTAQTCDGTLSLDWNSFAAASPTALGQPFTAGQRIFVQGWFRDPAAPAHSNLSNGLWFELQL